MKALITIIALLFVAGCTTIRKGDFEYTSWLFAKSFAEVNATVDPNTGKVTGITIKDYNSDAGYIADIVGAVK
jgi:hypothetical protein